MTSFIKYQHWHHFKFMLTDLYYRAEDSIMKLTDFFPVRRSNRTSSAVLKNKKRTDLEEAILQGTTDGLEVIGITHYFIVIILNIGVIKSVTGNLL